MDNSFKHLDPTTTKVYQHYTVVYGFDNGRLCFKCKVRRGYLIGKRDSLPLDMGWLIGQHLDTVRQFIPTITPLILCSSG